MKKIVAIALLLLSCQEERKPLNIPAYAAHTDSVASVTVDSVVAVSVDSSKAKLDVSIAYLDSNLSNGRKSVDFRMKAMEYKALYYQTENDKYRRLGNVCYDSASFYAKKANIYNDKLQALARH